MERGSFLMNSNTVTCSFLIDRDLYEAYRSFLLCRGESPEDDLSRYMNWVVSQEVPNAQTRAAIEEVNEMIQTGSGQHFDGSTEEFFALLEED